MSVLPSDANGNHAVGRLLDALCEFPDETTEVFGPPKSWPRCPEYDGQRYGLGPNHDRPDDQIGAALYSPTQEDLAEYHAWCREQDERNQDLEDAYRESQYHDALEGISRYTDDDLEAAGLPVG